MLERAKAKAGNMRRNHVMFNRFNPATEVETALGATVVALKIDPANEALDFEVEVAHTAALFKRGKEENKCGAM